MIEQPLVVVVSDCTDVAFAEMRGAIRSAAGDVVVHIEPLVPVHQFSVVNAAFILRLVVDAYPARTIVSVVVNPISERTERIVGRLAEKDVIFEGTNTGQFGWLIDEYGLKECYELADPGFVPFGGKYVHAPVVGRIAAGEPLSSLGKPFEPALVRRHDLVDGLIVHVDNFGNGKFRWNCAGWKYGDDLRVTLGDRVINAVYWQRMMDRADDAWVIYPGSSLQLTEIGQVRGEGLHALGIRPGEQLWVQKA